MVSEGFPLFRMGMALGFQGLYVVSVFFLVFSRALPLVVVCDLSWTSSRFRFFEEED